MFTYLVNTKKSIKNKLISFKAFLFDLIPHSSKNNLQIFSMKFADNSWGGIESLSGHGSDFASTKFLRKILPKVLEEYAIKSFLDAPCGDFYWMNLTNLNVQSYIGIDIVPELISQNQNKYGASNRQFLSLDITSDTLPKVDLILCRDCLVHLSFKQIRDAIKNFKKSGSTYLLTTTYPDLLQVNKNIVTGDWRPLDLQKYPFNFPEPIKIINENCITDLKEKSLGLWKISDLEL